MQRQDAIDRLRDEAERIKRFGVTSLFLFGSTARGEAGAESDVDLFVDYDLDRFGLIELVEVERHVSGALGKRADLTTRDGLHPLLRAGIEAEAVQVF